MIRRWVPFFIIYVLVHGAAPDHVRSYDGQSQAQITTLLAGEGNTGEFITPNEYLTFIVAHTPLPVTVAQLRSEALEELNAGIQAPDKVQRAVYLVALDEINLLRQRDVARSADVAASTSLADLKTRWAARAALDDRTVTQFKTAVQGKITSGLAD